MSTALKKRPPVSVCVMATLAVLAVASMPFAGEAQDKAAQPGAPKIVFNPKRPIPEPPGDVRNIESLTKPPPGYTTSKRNNFYKKENGKTVPGTDLYRWANSGHWSNYDEAEVGKYKLQGQFDVYNAFNDNAVGSENTTFGSLWRQPIDITQGRLLKFGVQVEF